jgi:flagellar assembly protein FliH
MTYLSNIIRASDYLSDVVVVAGGHTRRFTPTHLGGDDYIPPVDEAAVQRAQLETAKEQAERIVAEAEAQVDSIVAEATARGFEVGLSEGQKAAEEESREYLQRLSNLITKAATDRETMIRSSERELSALAYAIAAKVIHREIATDPSVVLSMVESALQRMPIETRVRVLVHPDDLDFVRSRWLAGTSPASLGCEVEVASDERVDRGGCIIESRGGTVDSRIETQLARIADSLEAGQ